MSAPAIISSGTAAGGPPVGGSGTSSPSTIPRWTGPSTLGDSRATDDGTTFVVGSGAYAGTALPGGMQLKTTVPIYVATDGTRTTIVGTDGTTSCFVGSLTNHNFQIRANNTIAITVQPGGNVGIGTASPGSRVSVRSNTTSAGATPIYTIQANRQNSDTAGFLIGMDGNLDAALAVNGDSRSIRFGKDVSATFTEWGRFDSAGNFGIGTASPISPLQVKGNATNTDGILTLTPNSGGRNHQVQSLQASSLFRIYDQSAGASRLEIDISGNVKVATTAAVFDASGTQQGLKLPATPGATGAGTEQILDCYNEGSLTSGFTLSGITTSAGNVNYTARWTRIGRTIAISLRIYPDAGATLTFASGWTVTMTGFPQLPASASCAATSDDGTLGRASVHVNQAATPIAYGGSAGAYVLSASASLFINGIST